MSHGLSATREAPPTCDCFIPFALEGSTSINATSLANRLKSGIAAAFPGWSVKDVKIKLAADGRLGTCCKDGKIGREITGSASADVSFTLLAGPNFEMEPQEVPGWDSVSNSGDGLLGVELKVAGSVRLQLEGECKEEAHVCGSGSLSVQAFAGAQVSGNVTATKAGVTFSGSVSGALGMQGTVTATLSGCDGNITLTVCGRVMALANLNGTLSAGDRMEPFSMSADSVVAEAGCTPAAARLVGGVAAGLPDPGPIVEAFDAREFLNSDEEIRRLLNLTNRAPTAVCTQVKIRLDQQAVVSRDAFKATLEIINSTATPLTSVGAEVVVKDSSGQIRTSQFGLREPILTSLTAVDGTGRIEGNTRWPART